MVTHLNSLPELNSLLASNKSRLVVIDFHATWCGPCHAIAPVFDKLAQEHKATTTFAKVDVDKASDISRAYQVRAMPTFVFVRNERKVGELKGADPKALEAMIRQHSTSAGPAPGSTFPGQGQTLSGTPVPTEVPPVSWTSVAIKYLLWPTMIGLWVYFSRKTDGKQ
ncbi:hypothetical protein JCM10212_004667 [Sporobolomyces blumeae]